MFTIKPPSFHMRPSQKFLRLPVIMYDALSLRNAMEVEDHFEENLSMKLTYHEPVDSVVGFYSMKVDDIEGWSDTYTRDRTIGEVQENGFNATEVYLKNDNPIVCPISSAEFERIYDRHCCIVDKPSFWQRLKRLFGRA